MTAQGPVDNFYPNRIFYIKLRSRSKLLTIDIFDLTPHITSTYGSKEFVENIKTLVKTLVKTATLTPHLVITKEKFWTTRVVVLSGQYRLAELEFPMFSSEKRITFASDSPHSSHPVTVSPKSTFSRGQKFILDSLPYNWSMDSKWNSRDTTLYRGGSNGDDVGNDICARCLQFSPSSTEGIVGVDTRKIDEVVAVLTAWISMLVVHRRSEDSSTRMSSSDSSGMSSSSSGGGGGGGGD